MENEIAVLKTNTSVARKAQSWFAGNDPVPTSLSKSEWTDWIAWACREHRNMAWKVADLIGFGMDRFSEAYYTLVESTGYERGYIEKIEGWVKRGLTVTRRKLLEEYPECEGVPHSWWEAVSPFRDEEGRAWGDMGCKQDQIIESRKMLILAGWFYGRAEDGSYTRLETHAFKALCVEFRKRQGWVEEPRGTSAGNTASPVSTTDGKDDTPLDFSLEDAEEEAPLDVPFKPDGQVAVVVSAECIEKVKKFAAYWQIEGPFVNDDTIERIVNQFYAIKKERLGKCQGSTS